MARIIVTIRSGEVSATGLESGQILEVRDYDRFIKGRDCVDEHGGAYTVSIDQPTGIKCPLSDRDDYYDEYNDDDDDDDDNYDDD